MKFTTLCDLHCSIPFLAEYVEDHQMWLEGSIHTFDRMSSGGYVYFAGGDFHYARSCWSV